MRTFFSSIRFRLVMWFFLILALVLTVFSIFIYISQVRELRAEAIGHLGNKMEEIEHLFLDSNRDFRSLQQAMQAGPRVLSENEIFLFLEEDGKSTRIWGEMELDEVSSITFDRSEQSPNRNILNGYARQEGDEENIRYLFLVVPSERFDINPGYFLIGMPLDPADQLHQLVINLLASGLLTLMVALLGGFWLSDRAMRPVRDITQAARQISAADLSLRLKNTKQDEIGQLAETFNDMLSRLESAFQRQKQFTADASHELRTPLTIISLEIGNALLMPQKTQEYQRVLKVIQSENDLMARLVNDLLMLARMDSGQAKLHRESLDLGELTLEVVERLTPLAAKNSLTLKISDFPVTMVFVDKQHLTRLLTNLVENAIKYTSGNKPGCDRKVCVDVEHASNPDLALVRVSDSGPGIPAEDLPHIFERFYRVDKSRSRQMEDGSSPPSGMGLGLAIAKWIAQIHGGEIAVESEFGKGTTFTLTLPLEK